MFDFTRTLACLLILLLSCNAYGQTAQADNPLFNGERTFTGGIVLGANISQVDGDTYYGYNKLGLNAGGIVYWNFVPRFSASVELLYSRKGTRGIDESYSSVVGPYFGKYYLKVNYAEVPLVFHYYFTPKYHFGLGASYAQLINSSEEYYGVDTYIFKASDYPFRKYNIDFVADAGMVLYKGYLLNVRYQYSLTPIRNAAHAPAGFGYGNQGQMNNLFSIRLVRLF